MKAIVVQDDRTVKVGEKPVPSIRPNEILLKILCVGLNPTDWKHIERSFAKPGDISGCDFVGSVVELGSDVPVSEVKKGEVRWGFMRGGQSPDRGGFAEYVAQEWDITSVVPPNVSPQQAASIPIPLTTVIQALYLHLKIPQPPTKADGQWIAIWSGATSVGQYAIQLAKLSGLRVATTASPGRWDLMKTLGADLIIDYKDPEVVQKLKDGTNDSIEYGIDCITEHGSTAKMQQTFRPAGGHLITVLFNLKGLPRTDVKTEGTLSYTALGKDLAWTADYYIKSTSEDRALFVEWCKKSTVLFGEGAIKPLSVDVLDGIEEISNGLDLLKNGKNSQKIVVNFS